MARGKCVAQARLGPIVVGAGAVQAPEIDQRTCVFEIDGHAVAGLRLDGLAIHLVQDAEPDQPGGATALDGTLVQRQRLRGVAAAEAKIAQVDQGIHVAGPHGPLVVGFRKFELVAPFVQETDLDLGGRVAGVRRTPVVRIRQLAVTLLVTDEDLLRLARGVLISLLGRRGWAALRLILPTCSWGCRRLCGGFQGLAAR